MAAGVRVWALVMALVVPAKAAAQEFFTLKGHGGPIKGIAALGDSIATASFDNSIGLWQDGAPLWLEGHEAAANVVVFVPGGLVSGADDYSVRFWTTEGTPRVLGRHKGKVLQLDVHPDGTHVASASWDRTAGIWPLNGAEPVVIDGHDNNVNDVLFVAGGTRLLTASTDGTIREWDSATGRLVRQVVSHGFGINTLVADEAAGWLAYGAADGGTRVVDLNTGAVIGDFTLDRRPILAMDYAPATGLIAVGDAHGYIMMLDAADWRIAQDFRATLSGPIWALAFSPDGANVHAGGLDDAMYSWPVATLGEAPAMQNTERSFLRPASEMSNGERQFQRKCSICHALGEDGQRRAGPTLHGIFGRAAGSLSGYPYSPTLDTSDIIWTDETIDALFDLGPDHYIPGSKMPMQRITDPADRADLVAFLRAATGAD